MAVRGLDQGIKTDALMMRVETLRIGKLIISVFAAWVSYVWLIILLHREGTGVLGICEVAN